jgi:hypothetical protein
VRQVLARYTLGDQLFVAVITANQLGLDDLPHSNHRRVRILARMTTAHCRSKIGRMARDGTRRSPRWETMDVRVSRAQRGASAMTPDEHHVEAEELLAEARALTRDSADYERITNILAQAKVHAILSLGRQAADVVDQPPFDDPDQLALTAPEHWTGTNGEDSSAGELDDEHPTRDGDGEPPEDVDAAFVEDDIEFAREHIVS